MSTPREQFDEDLRRRARNVDTSTNYILNDEAYAQDHGQKEYMAIVKDLLDGSVREGGEFQVHVFPDQRPVLLQAMFNFKDLNDNLIRAEQPDISKATFVAYVLAQWNVFMYLNDKYRTNGSESAYATPYGIDSTRKDFILEMSQLPIPDFLAQAFTTLTTSTLPNRNNIRFSMTAKGFIYGYDFGRFFPITIFLQIHNLIAERDSEINKADFWKNVFERLIHVWNNEYVHIGNFFGVLPIHGFTTSRFVDSPLFRYLNSYFNDIFSQDVSSRRIYESLPIQNVTMTSPPNYYDMIFGFSRKNFEIYKRIFRDAAGLLKTYNFGENTIQRVIFQEDNLRILAPAYMELNPPTWSYKTIGDVGELKPMTKKEMSLALNFKIVPDLKNLKQAEGLKSWNAKCDAIHDTEVSEKHPNTAEEIAATGIPYTYTTKVVQEKTEVKATFTGSLTGYAATHTSQVTNPPLTDFRVYNDEYTEPGAIIDRPLQLIDFTPMMPYMAGLFIENDEIDGTAVPIPNPDGINAVENSYFLCSALPVQLFYDACQLRPIYSRKRIQRNDDTGIYSGIVVGDRSVMNRNILASQYGRLQTANVQDPFNVNNLNPGMTIDNVTWQGKEASVIASEIKSPFGDNKKESSYPNIDFDKTNYKIPGWSCYRYVVDEEADTLTGQLTQMDLSNYYYLMNLRTIFGAQVDTKKVTNFFECIPEL
jgi:hypothetical protein